MVKRIEIEEEVEDEDDNGGKKKKKRMIHIDKRELKKK
jgi:hypothetical protein